MSKETNSKGFNSEEEGLDGLVDFMRTLFGAGKKDNHSKHHNGCNTHSNKKDMVSLFEDIFKMGDSRKKLIEGCESGCIEEIENALKDEMDSLKQDMLNFAIVKISNNSKNNETSKYLLDSMTEIKTPSLLYITESDNEELIKYIFEKTNLVPLEDDELKHMLLTNATRCRKYDTVNYLMGIYKAKD